MPPPSAPDLKPPASQLSRPVTQIPVLPASAVTLSRPGATSLRDVAPPPLLPVPGASGSGLKASALQLKGNDIVTQSYGKTGVFYIFSIAPIR